MSKIKEWTRKIIRSIVKGALFAWFKINNRVKIIGTENIPKEGALIFCGNHRTFADPPLIEVTGKREMRFLAKEELYKNKFLAFLGWAFQAIPVKRDSKDVSAIKVSLKELKKGNCIALFPEGTRNGLQKGESVKDGAAFMAIRSGALVIPCGIKGGEKGNKRMTVTYGKPLDFSKYKGSKDKEVIEGVTKEIMDNILELAK